MAERRTIGWVHDEPSSVGERIRIIRRRRGITQQILADRSGLKRSAIANYESGSRPVDSRQHLYALADALGVSVGDLTGHRDDTHNPSSAEFHACVPDIEAALMAAGLIDDAQPLAPLHQLLTDAQRSITLRTECDYAGLGKLLPGLISGLYRHTLTGTTSAQTTAWSALTTVTLGAAIAVKTRGYIPLAWIAARAAREAAGNSGSSAGVAAADFAHSQVLLARPGATTAALAAAENAADTLARDIHTVSDIEVYGMLHLQASLASAALGKDPAAHLDEAARAAARKLTLARPAAAAVRMPTFDAGNVGIWRMSAATERREGGKALEIARSINPGTITAKSRRSQFFVEVGRAHYMEGRPRDALHSLLRAEQTAPQHIRTLTVVRELVGQMMRKAQRDLAHGDLGKLAWRMGVVPI